MLRKTLLYLSNQQKVFTFVRRNRLAKRMASRFVAGETIADAMVAVRALNARGITVSLDLLGESVYREEEARATAQSYLELPNRLRAALAALVGGSPDEIALTTGASAGTAVLAFGMPWRPGDDAQGRAAGLRPLHLPDRQARAEARRRGAEADRP